MARLDPSANRLPLADPRAGRVVVLAPEGKGPPVTCEILEQVGIATVAVRSVEELCRILDQGAAAVLLPEEAIVAGEGGALRAWAARQPPWSDLPVLVLAAPGAASSARSPAVDLLAADAHVTLLDRPFRLVTLVSAVTAALRVRLHQYRMRGLLDRLAESVRTRDQFLAMLGHELRNPLAAIHTATELLLRGPSEPERAASIIARQTRKLARLVDDLLEVSRVESGKIVLKRRVVDLRAVVERSVDAMAARAEAAGLRLEVVHDREPVPVDGDPVRLEQVVGNLLSNAVKYTAPGGSVAVEVERVVDVAIVRVADTGRASRRSSSSGSSSPSPRRAPPSTGARAASASGSPSCAAWWGSTAGRCGPGATGRGGGPSSRCASPSPPALPSRSSSARRCRRRACAATSSWSRTTRTTARRWSCSSSPSATTW